MFKPDYGIEKPEKKTITLDLADYYVILTFVFCLGCLLTSIVYEHI
jgi:hypothetical protein